MNKLFATWHVATDHDVVDHLAQAHGQLIDIPELESALDKVDAALAEVSAWAHRTNGRGPGPSPYRSDASASTRSGG